MEFAPHILQKQTTELLLDENRNPDVNKNDWETVGACRCDDNGQHEKVSVNGVFHDYKYHVVYVGEKISIGTAIKVLDESGNIRGEGEVIKTSKCNFFDYSEIWM